MLSSTSVRRSLAVALTGAVVALAATSAPAPAQARSGPAVLTVVYDAAGTTTVARSGFDVPIGPTQLTAGLAQDGTFRATLPLPRQTVSFQAPDGSTVKTDVLFRQIGRAKGALVSSGDSLAVNSTATYQVLIRKASINGKPQHVGHSCRTTHPFTATVQTPAGQSFSIDDGGPLDGTYTLPAFQHCGAATDLINLLVPGSGNVLHLVLANGRISG